MSLSLDAYPIRMEDKLPVATTEGAMEGKSLPKSCLSEKIKQSITKINEFFENHSTIRKIVAHVPNNLFRIALIVNGLTSFKLFADSRYLRVASYILILGFCDSIRDLDYSLSKKKIEHTN